jgi:GNAT superfamily N-acetyltransferase
LLIIILAQLIWAPFKTIVRTVSTHGILRSRLPSLLTEYRKTPFTLQDGLSEWKGEGGLVLAVDEDDLIGVMRLDRRRTYFELSSFAVNPAYQGRGYGGQMLEHAISRTDMPIWLRAHRDNPACKLYSRHGFEARDLVNNRFVMRLR